MKHRPLLYLETSVFGFCFDEKPRNVLRREAASTLLQQADLGLFEAVTSPLTLEELKRAAQPLQARLLQAARGVRPLEVDRQEVEHLAAAYLRTEVIPRAYADDAGHVAYATIGKADVLVTLNLKHLANEWAERRLNAVNLLEGYQLLSIRTPEEVLRYAE
jgi:predicted nucleic acid-binding protein